MLHWMTEMIRAGGYWGVAALMAIENVILPLPSELIMPLAGHAAGNGRMTLWGVILAGTVGSVIGALPMYLPARFLGEDRFAGWLDRHARWLLKKGDIEKAKRRFGKRSTSAVFIAQLLPGLRGVISLPAGFAKMNIFLFLLANFAGTLIWCAVLAWAGMLLGRRFEAIDRVLGPTGWAIMTVIILGGFGWLMWRRRRGKNASSRT